ncbi:hypothetical protein, conserved [Babesia ovata]|uniref:Uncharacterized protein n=1 Tax=Babesia ovata TaxID=189622 RepID=A0A2H6KGJ4_9APIC|nr:uncharacterized protein BOVATA_035940 [Babesia ovata]GBE62101.1 hypothetical protein, conserved [Babesia ovata]
MVYNSLTEAPRNLKEGIDWLMALKGTSKFNTQALGFAVHRILADTSVGLLRVPAIEKVKRVSKEFLEQKELKGRPYVKNLLSRFREPMNKTDGMELKRMFSVGRSDYVNLVKSEGIKPEDIAKDLGQILDACEKFLDEIKNPDQYESAYSPEATWAKSCSKSPEACAVIFVGIAPMLEAGLRSLRCASRDAASLLSHYDKKKHLKKLMKALGYGESECRANMSASYIFKASENVGYIMLGKIYDLAGFWAFY